MLTLQSRLRVNEEEVAAKILDGEAIMINLSNGIYYSMGKVGALLWELITSGQSLEEIVTILTQRYDVSADQAQADVERLAAELLEEKLVVTSNQETALREMAAAADHTRLAYEPPNLEIYRDIGHLIALDPPMPGLEGMPWNDPDEKPSR